MARTVRKSRPEDASAFLNIYEIARNFMRSTGNPNQWGSVNPPKEVVFKDIENGLSYAVEEDGRVVGVFVYFVGEDPTYRVIEDGSWLNEEPYGVIHRIAGDGKAKGIFNTAVEFALGQCKNLRIDTHRDNRVMQHLLDQNGFTRCGIIHLLNGDPRIAYQRNDG